MSSTELDETISEQIPIIHITENGIEGFEILCRLCANRSEPLIPIYSEEGISNDLSSKMNRYLPVKVAETDTLPLQCCYQCASTVLTWHELVIASVEADRRLRDLQIEAEKHLEEQNAQANLEQTEIKSDSDDGRDLSTKLKDTIRENFKTEIQLSDIELNADDPPEPPSKPRKTYQCTQCGQHFFKNQSLERHSRIHSDERPFTCDKCGKQFRDRSGLNRHMRDVHIGVKAFPCDICSKTFASKNTRDDHRRRHTTERPFVCATCGKTFASKASLHIHSKTHLDVFPFNCAACGKKFRRRQELSAHSSIHSGEKPFVCHVCGKRFRIKNILTAHMTIHNQFSPFVCKICGQAFKQIRYLKSHMQSKHYYIVKNRDTE